MPEIGLSRRLVATLLLIEFGTEMIISSANIIVESERIAVHSSKKAGRIT